MIELRGDSVVLRTLEREHCRELWEAYEPGEPRPTEPLRPGMSAEGADKWFEESQEKQGRERVTLGIFCPDGRLVGNVQLANIDWRHRTATVGGGIARRRDRGQGYGSDATRVMVGYAFEHLDMVRVSASTVEYDEGAQQALLKCGFVQEGRERQAVFCQGQRWDRLRYGLLREELVS